MDENCITDAIIGAARTGNWLLELTHETCLAHELASRKIACLRQVGLPVVYKGVVMECGYRIDLLVEDLVIVEIKAVERLDPIHEAQLMSYLKLSGRQVGLLLNKDAQIHYLDLASRAHHQLSIPRLEEWDNSMGDRTCPQFSRDGTRVLYRN